MTRKKGSSGTVLLVIVVALGLLMFFGVLTFKAGDMNDFVNLLRDIWKAS